MTIKEFAKVGIGCVAMGLGQAAWAQSAEVQPLILPVWPEGKMPGRGAQEAEKETPGGIRGTVIITNVSAPNLTVYPATASSGSPTPFVLVCPGGGYSVLAFTKEGTDIAQWLNAMGITSAILKYRVPANREGALQDVERAIRVVRSHEKDWKIDGSRVGVIGFSAGGHLTARLSASFEAPAYATVDEVDKLSCRPDFVVLVYPAFLEKEGKLAPEFTISAKMPPMLMVHNEDDAKFIAGSKVYDAALTVAGVPHEFLLYQTGGHGYGLKSSKEVGVWPERCREWLGKNGVLK